MLRPCLMMIGLAFSFSCSTPQFLQKYFQEPDRENRKAKLAPGELSSASPASPAAAISARGKRPAIFPLDSNTFRIQLSYDRVWDAMLDILLRNYNLAIADRQNGLITTEWDSYYLEGKVHRNKISMRVKRLAGQGVELTLFNNVEVLSKLPDGGLTEIWLPTDKNKQELSRLVQNLAIATGSAKPDLAGVEETSPLKPQDKAKF